MARSKGKWSKHRLLAGCAAVAAALPATHKLSERSFWSLLDRYGKVMVKPSGGWGGKGVMQVAASEGEMYSLQRDRKVRSLGGRREVYGSIARLTRKGSWVVQQKISLAKVNGRPFDMRVMVQRTRSSGWGVTGRLAKIAGRGFVVTNTARSRGKVTTISRAVSRSNAPASVSGVTDALDRISLRAVSHLHRYYRWIHTVGMDMGLDQNGKVWIIEANFNPDKTLFLKLKDKSAYRRIMSRYRSRSRRSRK